MKRFLSKKVTGVILTVAILAIPTHSVYATEYSHTGCESSHSSISGQPEQRRCDIGEVYRTINGVMHERLWCYTCGEWMEDGWSVSK